MIKYARHPERYPLEQRYHRIRQLVLFVFRRFHLDLKIADAKYFTEHEEPCVVYSNHTSYLDPLLLIAISEKPLTFVAKKEAMKFPFIGKVVAALDGISMNREDLREQLVAIDHAVKLIESGRNIAIFPEGTRSKYPERPLAKFKPGAFKLSYRTGAAIIPCAFYGTFRPLSSKSKLKVYPIWIRFFEPITKNDFLQINTVHIAPIVQEKIQREIDDVMREQDRQYLEKLAITSK
jgi:1-acyl-sn-glycerol-3-phosphate acyltransferase